MSLTSEVPPQWIHRKQRLLSDLQSHGLRILGASAGVKGRKGGAGPSDHRAVNLLGTTLMVPVFNRPSESSPFTARPVENGSQALLFQDGRQIGTLSFPAAPRFYSLSTEDGIPYWKIAQLHARNVLATTVLQNCFRYVDMETRCQFCAIGESLKGGRTIAQKTPRQLAEVAEAAQRLDGVKHMVMTTGTPHTADRGAAVLCQAAAAVKQRTGLPIQAQCEPPESFEWFERLRECGVDSLGMHLEAFDPEVRHRIMPGKAEVPVQVYMEAYREAVSVFGWGQVSTYLLAGLGDTREGLLQVCRNLIDIGVYPFVVPFVPLSGTPLENHSSPAAEFMRSVLEPLGRMLREAGMTSATIKAGCGKCGACSSLTSFEG